MMAVLRACDRAETSWRNGGGTTSTIAAFPPDAGVNDFDWRISTATVAQAGPFSIFPGVDRHLTVLDGTLELTVGKSPPVLLAQGESLRFAADVPVHGAPVDSPVTDLNVMTRRGLFESDVRSIGDQAVDLPAGRWIIIATGGARIETASQALSLGALDAAALSGPATARIDGRCILIGILPAGR